jgi:signal transduction histidine kinase
MAGRVPLSAEAFDHLNDRVRKLAEEKSHLQLIIHMMRRMSTAPGLEGTVGNLLNTVMEHIGGTNITLYYSIHGRFQKTDITGNEAALQEIDLPLAKRAFETKEVLEEDRGAPGRESSSPDPSAACDWAYPLLVGQKSIGSILIEGAYAGMQGIHAVLPIFFSYAAFVLKNEIYGFTQLQEAYQELSQANATMAKEIAERRQAEYRLQESAEALARGHADLQEAYDRLKNAHTQLLQKDKMASIGQLAAGIAHEINTPTQFLSDNTVFLRDSLKDLLGFLADLRQECAPSGPGPVSLTERMEALDLDYLIEEIPRAIQQSQEGVTRVARIVSAMKDFSHPSSDGKNLVDLNQAITTTITVSRNEWKYVATLETDFDPELPKVPCSLGEFNQVILNLLVNSAHAIRDAQAGQPSGSLGQIRVSTRWKGVSVEIQVADTGAGIPKEIQPRIFEPFFTTKEVGKGTGLGLSIAYDIIVNKHGGSIRVDSEAGKGTTFVLTLPLSAE